MRILLAGGAGFLGSNLLSALISQNHDILVLDDLSTGSEANLARSRRLGTFDFKNHDIREPLDVGEQFDLVLNFACPASPVHYQSDPLKTLTTNFDGTRNLLDYAKKVSARYLQASTSEIYGDPLRNPQDETYWGNVNPIGVRSCYDEGKRAAETLVADYRRLFSLDARIIRIFNTYGPNMSRNDGRVVSNFVVQAIENSPLTVYGAGTQTRSFCYVDDLIKGIMTVIFSEQYEGPINLGNPSPVSMIELAKLVIKLCASSSEIVFHPLPMDDPLIRVPSIERANQIYNWYPKVDLISGLNLTIDYFRNANVK